MFSQFIDHLLLDNPVPWSCIQNEIKIPAHRDLEPGSDREFDLIATWYSGCRQQHVICSIRNATEGPKRLLNLGGKSTGSSNIIRLEECDPAILPDFIALSHCWGQGEDQPLKTVKTTVELQQTGIEISSLSRTFHDAVAVSRRLGEQYLWIDSLCIIQDDDEDKAKEIPRM